MAEKELENIQKLIAEEVKPVIKKKFDYDIPIAKVEDAGITTTGAASEGNQLPALVEEYRNYCATNKLWIKNRLNYEYMVKSDVYYRVCNGQEVRINV